jgi:hypothetical protein
MGKPQPPIVFEAVVAKVQTMVDGGIRVSFDLPETAIPQVAELMECKRSGIALLVETQPLAFIPT